MNLNNCDYSYANVIGSYLKQPLFKLVSHTLIAFKHKHWEMNRIHNIAKEAIACLIFIMFVVPIGISWLIGKSISCFSKTKINHKNLHLKPPEIDIPHDLESDSSISIMVLVGKFIDINTIKGKFNKSQQSKLENLGRLCEWTVIKNDNIYPNDYRKRELFCKQLSIYLKNIVKKIDSNEVSNDKTLSILSELAEASTRCYPTWLEVARRLCDEVNGKEESVEIKLLRLVQEYKESIILEFSQKEVNSEWHALSYVRNILGDELGLNTAKLDVYGAQNNSIFGKCIIKWLFLQIYENSNRLVSGITTMINSREYDNSYYFFIQKHATDVKKCFNLESDGHINEVGVNFLLKNIKCFILK